MVLPLLIILHTRATARPKVGPLSSGRIHDHLCEQSETGSSAYASDLPPSNYQTTPRTIPASANYNAPPTSSSEQTSSRYITSDQGASNTRDRPSYANPGQSEPLGASYGSGGDHATQRFDDVKGKSVAKPYSGQTTSGQQAGYGGYDYSDYHGASQYGQCKYLTPLVSLHH